MTAPVTLNVPCNGAVHRVTFVPDGPVILHDHPRASRRDEWALAEATGDLQQRVPYAPASVPHGCFRVLQCWRKGLIPAWADRDIEAEAARWTAARQLAVVARARRNKRQGALMRCVDTLVITRIAIAAYRAARDVRRALDDLGWSPESAVSVSFSSVAGVAVLRTPSPLGDVQALYVGLPAQALFRFWRGEVGWRVDSRAGKLWIVAPRKREPGEELEIWRGERGNFAANRRSEGGPDVFLRYDLLPGASSYSRRCVTWPAGLPLQVPLVSIPGTMARRLPEPRDFAYVLQPPDVALRRPRSDP